MIQIEVPLPPAACHPHAKGHWRPKAEATKEYRQMAKIAAIQQTKGCKFLGRCRVSHEWFMGKCRAEQSVSPLRSAKRYRPRDIANAIASLKAAIDGIVDAGVIGDDNHKVLQWGDCTLHRDAKSHGGKSCVVLRFEEMA